MNKRPLRLPAALLLLALPFLAACNRQGPASAPQAQQPAAPKILPFPQDDSDLKPDPAARFGTLANGLRYVILPNHEPRGRISMRLLVMAGSFNERDDQRGLAHFVEHMAFNGSKHYPTDTLVLYLQHLGMQFGADTNASTGFNRTMYILELPHADDKTLAKGLQVFGDYADGLLMPVETIDRESKVVLSEKRYRDTPGYRTFVAQFEAMLGNTLLPKRMPIGDPQVVSTATRDKLLEFWNQWYRPERMAVIIVGDFSDPAKVENMVKAAYSGIQPRTPALDDPPLGVVPQFHGVHPVFHAEADAPATDVAITIITPYQREPDTAAHELKLLPRSLAIAMMDRRFDILAKKPDAQFTSAGASVADEFNFYRDSSVELTCKPEQWDAALSVGEQELRRAMEYGFTNAELKDAVASFLKALNQAVKTESTRSSKPLANEIAQSLVDGSVFTTPDADLALLKPALDKITPKDCLDALRSDFAENGRYVMVSGNVQIPGDPDAAIAAAYTHSQAVAVAAPVEEKEVDWAYTDFGAPGKVVEHKHIDDLNIDLVTFENGVRLNIKKTDFDAGRILMSARIGGGVVTEPAGERGLDALAGATFDAGGLGRHSADDLERIFAGRNVSVAFHPGTDAFDFSGSTTPDDLLLEMQLLAAKITDPGYRPEALRDARKELDELYTSFEHTARGPLATDVANLIAGGDPRIGMPEKDAMMGLNLDEVKDWLAPQLAHGPLEVALVGDLDVNAAIDAAAKTIGALPPRDPRPDLAALEKIAFPSTPFVKQYALISESPKTQLALYWPTNDGMDIRRRRRLAVLAEVLSDRLRVSVRQKIGGSYSPRADSDASETFPGYGYIEASLEVDPALAAKISDIAVSTADDLAAHGMTADELDRVRLPLLTSLKESLRSNDYWLTAVLARAQEKPEMLDWARNRIDDINSITTADLDALAKQYLGRDRVSRVSIQLSTSTADASEPDPAPANK